MEQVVERPPQWVPDAGSLASGSGQERAGGRRGIGGTASAPCARAARSLFGAALLPSRAPVVAYRFCRPDDIPELVAAVNQCYDVHFDAAPLTVDTFRREMRELQLWPSNSMLARAGEEPVAVVLGTKRSREVLVRRIGVAPGYQRRGYGRHLLESLSHKLAVLGPPRLVAEVPATLTAACAFFAGAGWRQEGMLRDWVCDAGAGRFAAAARGGPAGEPPTPMAEEARPVRHAFAVTAAELEAVDLLSPGMELAWERQLESLRAAPELRGLALAAAAGGAIRAWALYRPGSEPGAVVLRYAFPAGGGERLLGPLLAAVRGDLPGSLRLLRLGEDELPEALLAELGFRSGETFRRFAAAAEAA